MSKKMRPIIDCTEKPDLLAHWPVADDIKASPSAAAIIEDLDASWVMEGADCGQNQYEIDADNRIIKVTTGGLSMASILRSDYLTSALILSTFAALRAAWHAEREEEARNIHRPDLWLLLGRLVNADIAALTARMAHEAKQDGDETLWRHALGDDNGDIAIAYYHDLSRISELSDSKALTSAFTQWFTKPARVCMSDAKVLAMMDENLEVLTMSGRGHMGEGALRCLTLDPLTGRTYLGKALQEFSGNPVWRTIADPVIEAHFLQVMGEIGTTRQGAVAIRDKKLAARLFPEGLVNV